MKILLSLLLSFLSSFVFAFNVQIDRVDGKSVASYNPGDWSFVIREDNYNAYVSTEGLTEVNGMPILFTLTELIEPFQYSSLEGTTKRIYDYGILDCDNKTFSILGEMYTTSSNEVQYVINFRPGQHMINMLPEGTARYEILRIACSTSI